MTSSLMTENSIFHITTSSEWATAKSAGEYAPRDYEGDGFIHCSYAHQLISVANSMFHGQSGLVLLEIDRAAVGSEVVDENLSGGSELFPHIYGRLQPVAVIRIHNFPSKEDGAFELPASVSDG